MNAKNSRLCKATVAIACAIGAGSIWFTNRAEIGRYIVEPGYPQPTGKPAAIRTKPGDLPAHAARSVLANPAMTPSNEELSRPKNEVEAKIANQLLQALHDLPANDNTNADAQTQALVRAGIPDRYREGNRVLTEVALALTPEQIASTTVLERASTEVVENLAKQDIAAKWPFGSPVVLAKIPLDRLEWVAGHSLIAGISLQNIALPTNEFDSLSVSGGIAAASSNKTLSQGATASMVANLHRRGFDGDGITIGVIDYFDDDKNKKEIEKLQASGDLPKGKDFTRISHDGNFGAHRAGYPRKHGNAVAEIVHDMAPAAKIIAYDVGGTAWEDAIRHAANLDSRNQPLGAPRVQVLTASLGRNRGSMSDGSGRQGTQKSLYEAIRAARKNGVVLLKSAGNAAQDHWSGMIDGSAFDANGYLYWHGHETYHRLKRGRCTRVAGFLKQEQIDGAKISISAMWSDWSATNQDYALELHRHDDSRGWSLVARSDNPQNNGPGQSPEEHIDYAPQARDASKACQGSPYPAGIYAIRVKRVNASVPVRLRVFAPKLTHPTGESSLNIPADSEDLISVAALDVKSSTLEDYSSRGPVLGPGGTQPTTAFGTPLKPDLSSYANVDTVTYAPGVFNGTSSATPHAAGLAALLAQQLYEYAAYDFTGSDQTDAGRKALRYSISESVGESLKYISSRKKNDLGAPGFDNSHGHGKAVMFSNVNECAEWIASRDKNILYSLRLLDPRAYFDSLKSLASNCQNY